MLVKMHGDHHTFAIRFADNLEVVATDREAAKMMLAGGMNVDALEAQMSRLKTTISATPQIVKRRPPVQGIVFPPCPPLSATSSGALPMYPGAAPPSTPAGGNH